MHMKISNSAPSVVVRHASSVAQAYAVIHAVY